MNIIRKKTSVIIASLFFVVTKVIAGNTPAELKTEKDKLSYAIGYNIGKSFKKDNVDFGIDLLINGLQDGQSGKQPLLPEKELNARMTALQTDARKMDIQRKRIAAYENRRNGIAYLAENGKKQGVITLPSGLQYKIIKEGTGAKPTNFDTVVCFYKGTLIDGTEFDSNEPGKPASLKFASLIPGWKEAIKLMTIGSKWQIVVPSTLGYGAQGAGQRIGPNETLLFDLELLGVEFAGGNADSKQP